jgi:hypothetical protein
MGQNSVFLGRFGQLHRGRKMKQADDFGFGTQIRKSPYFDATVRWGAEAFSVYNHMYIPRDFGDPEQNFWNLVDQAILCDVAVERQVEITGPDAAKFTQMLTCRDHQCRWWHFERSNTVAFGGKSFLDFPSGQRYFTVGTGRGGAFRSQCTDQRT